uniref:Uncharacterized protein n=1 Tax=Kalanchoe fedtschenkoi TaxID=63787 RepID=A0A7N0ULW5_KALFE
MLSVADTVDHPPPHHHRSQSSIQFSHSDKFFCKLLSKESDDHCAKSSNRNPSFRVYYGGSTGSVPFTWETTPGTPKHALFPDGDGGAALPPLTPPPSFFGSSKSGVGSVRSGSRKLLEGFLRGILGSKKTRGVSPFGYPSPSFNSASSDSSGGLNPDATRHRRKWRSLSALTFSVGPGEECQAEAPNSELFLGARREGILAKAASFGSCFRS